MTLAGLLLTFALFPRLGWTAANHRGDLLPVGAGWTFVAAGSLTLYLQGAPFPYWAGTALVGLLGWADDRLGDHGVRGVGGHVRAFFRGQITTGIVKLLGVGLLALWAAYQEYLLAWGLGTLLLGVATNTLNALDLRPGRAGKGWLLLVLAALLLGARGPIGYLAIPFLLYFPFDLRGRLMMGDTGANPLGWVWGLYLLSLPLWLQGFFLALLLAFHLWMEKHSLTRWLEAHPFWDFLDRLGRPR
ncbi:MAG: hypothetical protein QJR00_03610 [Bacillota bacterium]|nr:hypothetical protein [Bacillota bacterium]